MLQDLCEPRVVERVMSDEITLKQEGTPKTLWWAQVLVQICRSGSGKPLTTSMIAASAGLCVLTPKPRKQQGPECEVLSSYAGTSQPYQVLYKYHLHCVLFFRHRTAKTTQ